MPARFNVSVADAAACPPSGPETATCRNLTARTNLARCELWIVPLTPPADDVACPPMQCCWQPWCLGADGTRFSCAPQFMAWDEEPWAMCGNDAVACPPGYTFNWDGRTCVLIGQRPPAPPPPPSPPPPSPPPPPVRKRKGRAGWGG